MGLIALVAVVIGTWVENNESRLWGVPKSDYLEVLGSIMNSDGPAAAVDGHLVDEESNDDKSETSSDSQRAGKRDSFYFLMRDMRTRAQLQQQVMRSRAAVRPATFSR